MRFRLSCNGKLPSFFQDVLAKLAYRVVTVSDLPGKGWPLLIPAESACERAARSETSGQFPSDLHGSMTREQKQAVPRWGVSSAD